MSVMGDGQDKISVKLVKYQNLTCLAFSSCCREIFSDLATGSVENAETAGIFLWCHVLPLHIGISLGRCFLLNCSSIGSEIQGCNGNCAHITHGRILSAMLSANTSISKGWKDTDSPSRTDSSGMSHRTMKKPQCFQRFPCGNCLS